MAAAAVRFPIRFTGANRAMAALGLVPSRCYVEVDADEIRVHMGWAFSGRVPRPSVRSVRDDTGRVWEWGVHGWRGEWLVNGSSSRIVRLEIDPPARARVMGVAVRLRVLRVAVEDPDGLKALLSTGHGPAGDAGGTVAPECS